MEAYTEAAYSMDMVVVRVEEVHTAEEDDAPSLQELKE